MFDRSDALAISERTTQTVVLSTSSQIIIALKRLWRKFQGIEDLRLANCNNTAQFGDANSMTLLPVTIHYAL